MDLLKQEKGSITLFVVISMLFFVMFLTGMYMLSATAEKGVIEEQARIKEIYEQGVNDIDNVYATLDNDSKKKLKDVIKVGDYVAYDPTAGVTDENLLSYTSPVETGMSHGNGCSKTDDGIDLSKGQTFTANGNIKWRVLSINKETGEVVLISEEPIKTDVGRNFYMRGAIGYLYAEQELNEICKIYGYGKGANTLKEFKYYTGDIIEGLDEGMVRGSGARSINAEDINSITGYKHATQEPLQNTIYYPTKTTTTGVSSLPLTRDYPNSMYIYNGSDYMNKNDKTYKMLFEDEAVAQKHSYFLSSRSISGNSYSIGFHVDWVNPDGVVAVQNMLVSTNSDVKNKEACANIRPIVYLKSNLQTTGKDKNGAWMLAE